jgi:hypothetical protein
MLSDNICQTTSNIRIIALFVISDTCIVRHKRLRIFVTYAHTKFHTRSFSDSYVITTIQNFFTDLAQSPYSYFTLYKTELKESLYTTVYPKVSRLAAWSGNRKWYSSLPLSVVISLFCESA